MAFKHYPLTWAKIEAGDLSLSTMAIQVTIVSTAYDFSTAHDFLADITSTQRIGTSTDLQSKTVTGGVFDAADITLSALSSTKPMGGLVLFRASGSSATSELIAFQDVGVGFAVAPAGAAVTISWSTGEDRIFRLVS